jgi:hypothetical protein
MWYDKGSNNNTEREPPIMAGRYSVFLEDGTSVEHNRKDQALTFFEVTPSAVYATAGNGKLIAGAFPLGEGDATPEPTVIGFSEVGERGGRFYRENWGASGETSYQKNPRSVLRRAIGCTWKELSALGLDSNKTANETLDKLEAGTLQIEDLYTALLDMRAESEADATA